MSVNINKEAAIFTGVLLASSILGCRQADVKGAYGGDNGNVAAAEPLIPTVTPTTEAKVIPTSTPGPRLSPGDVYRGPMDRGGEMVFIAGSNGKIVFQASNSELSCSIPTFKPLKFLEPLPYDPSSFNHTLKQTNQVIEGHMLDSSTVEGKIGNEGYNLSFASGEKITCPQNESSYKGKKVPGSGTDAFLENLRQVLGLTALPPQIERTIRGYLGE